MRALLIILSTWLVASPLLAGTVSGRLEMLDRGGKPATDLSDIVVSVEGTGAKPTPAGARVAMKGKVFIPRVTVVTTGSTVEFPNDDPIFHNVFSLSGDNRFDLDLYKRPKSGSWTFRSPGVVRVYCNIHPQMSAYVIVLDTPFHTKAARDGTFTIEGVPAGSYTVRAWHERGGEATATVTVPATGTVEARLALDGSKYKRVQHKNKFGKAYSEEKY